MPRTSRSVAQRLATQTKSKRRRPTARPDAPTRESTAAPSTTPAPAAPRAEPRRGGPSVDQILDEVVPSAAGPRAAATPTVAPAAARRGVAGRTARPAPVRRRYSEYAEEYQYIWADLRRIAIVAGVLIALLIVLSFFIQ